MVDAAGSAALVVWQYSPRLRKTDAGVSYYDNTDNEIYL